MAEKFNSVSPTLLSSFSFCYNQEPLINEEIVVKGWEALVNTIISCYVDP